MQVTIKQTTADRLAEMACSNNVETGQMIDALLKFISLSHWFESDPAFYDRFIDILETAIAHTKGGGWGSCHPLVKLKEDGTADLRLLDQWIREHEQAGEA